MAQKLVTTLVQSVVALGLLGLLLWPGPAFAGPVAFIRGDSRAVTATATSAIAQSTVLNSVCGILFVNQTTTKLHVGFLNNQPDAAAVTTANSWTVCASGSGCTHADWLFVPAGNGALAYRSASGSISISIHYGVCNQ